MTRLMYSSYIIAQLSILTEVTMDTMTFVVSLAAVFGCHATLPRDIQKTAARETMTFAERNVFLSIMWKELSEEKRNEFQQKNPL